MAPPETAPPAPRSGMPCPRCHSINTKFCYYNNYSITQPRHFCKTCRRYWTRGGTLRNIPLGGASRKIKKPSSSSSSSSAIIDPLTGFSPAVDFQVAGTGIYPPSLSPFGDNQEAATGGPLLDLLQGLDFNNNNTDGFDEQIYYWKNLEQEQSIALPLLYGSGGGGGFTENKDNDYQKREGGVGPDALMNSDPFLLFDNQDQDLLPHADAAGINNGGLATTRWLFGETSSNNGDNSKKNDKSGNAGSSSSSSLKRWMSW